ncbi:DUF3611 family protein [Leptolyngbya sp. AN02str]|uniref:DUF3611 family protein n=1 Tax=Leptolyngbya sp. AN02str TaxID=3423363 RepID=UPI003D318624
MSSQLDSYTLPPAVKRVANAFRLTGWVSFWAQAAMGIISTLVLFFSSLFINTNRTIPNIPNVGSTVVRSNNPGLGFGLFLTSGGLIALYLGIFWAFRYVQLSRRLKSSKTQSRPKRGDAFQILRNGLVISIIGMFLTLLGAFSIVGALVGKSFQFGVTLGGLPSNFIEGADIFTVQGALLVLFGHFLATVSSLWLLRTMNRQ